MRVYFWGNLLAWTEARGCSRSSAFGGERFSAALEELAQTHFLPSFCAIPLIMRGARGSKSGICGGVGAPTLGARAQVRARLSFAAHFAPRW